MRKHLPTPAVILILSVLTVLAVIFQGSRSGQPVVKEVRQPGPEQDALQMIKEGRQTFQRWTAVRGAPRLRVREVEGSKASASGHRHADQVFGTKIRQSIPDRADLHGPRAK